MAQWTEEDRAAWEAVRAAPCERPFNKIKIFIFVQDVGEDTAPFAVMPGSHRMEQGQTYHDASGVERTAASEITERAAGQPGTNPADEMPGHKKFVGKAGDVLLWNGALFHAAMHNTSTQPRVLLLYNFVQQSSGVLESRSSEFRTGRSDAELRRWLPTLSPRFFPSARGEGGEGGESLREVVAQLMTGSAESAQAAGDAARL